MFECQNCTAQYSHRDLLDPIDDLYQRVDPGESFPAGQCLHCGALVHEIKEED